MSHCPHPKHSLLTSHTPLNVPSIITPLVPLNMPDRHLPLFPASSPQSQVQATVLPGAVISQSLLDQSYPLIILFPHCSQNDFSKINCDHFTALPEDLVVLFCFRAYLQFSL